MKENIQMNKKPEEEQGRFGPFSEPQKEMIPAEVEKFKKEFPHLLKEWEKIAEEIDESETR